jgi:hypothetical protein
VRCKPKSKSREASQVGLRLLESEAADCNQANEALSGSLCSLRDSAAAVVKGHAEAHRLLVCRVSDQDPTPISNPVVGATHVCP